MTTTSKPAHALSIHGKIDKLIANAQRDLDALLRTRELITGAAKNGKVHQHETVLARAVALDQERRTTVGGRRKPSNDREPPGAPTRARTSASTAAKRRSRQATARFLDKVAASGETPYMGARRGAVSVLLQHGYLKHKGGGYVRTDKVFTP